MLMKKVIYHQIIKYIVALFVELTLIYFLAYILQNNKIGFFLFVLCLLIIVVQFFYNYKYSKNLSFLNFLPFQKIEILNNNISIEDMVNNLSKKYFILETEENDNEIILTLRTRLSFWDRFGNKLHISKVKNNQQKRLLYCYSQGVVNLSTINTNIDILKSLFNSKEFSRKEKYIYHIKIIFSFIVLFCVYYFIK